MLARIEDWSIITPPSFFVTPPSSRKHAFIEGLVFEDPSKDFPDGTRATIKLKRVNFHAGRARSYTAEYQLGYMNFDFHLLIENSPYKLSHYEELINKVRLVHPRDDRTVAANWSVHRVVLNNGSVQVAVASFGDGGWKVIVKNGGYSIVRQGQITDEISYEAMAVLKQLPDDPRFHLPYIDFVRNGW